MKKFCMLLAVAVIGVFVFAKNVSAFSFPNPDPTILADDIGGTGYFTHSDLVASFELFDLGDPVPGGSTFGFFFEGADVTDSANLHTIFDPLDATGDLATVSFPDGQIIDNDIGEVPELQGIFTGSGNIGFFLDPHPDFALPILFTDPLLNPGGTDVALAFPFLDPSLGDFVLAFGFDDPTQGFPIVFAMEAIGGITPVPEPSTLLLFASGLVGLTLYGRKRFKGLIRK